MVKIKLKRLSSFDRKRSEVMKISSDDGEPTTTPRPRKAWEWHYRSFLSSNKQDPSRHSDDKPVRGESNFKGMFKPKPKVTTNKSVDRVMSDDEDDDGDGNTLTRTFDRVLGATNSTHATQASPSVVSESCRPPDYAAVRELIHGPSLERSKSLQGDDTTKVGEMSSASDPSIMDDRRMKIAFTEFHNQKQLAKDATSPYLGDETSYHRANVFTNVFPDKTKTGFTRKSSDLIPDLSRVLEDDVLLHPVKGWMEDGLSDDKKKKQNYLMVTPLILSAYPSNVLTAFDSLARGEDEGELAFTAYAAPYVPQMPETRVREDDRDLNWIVSSFAIRRNYLLEFGEGGLKGTAHLEKSAVVKDAYYEDAFVLEFCDYSLPFSFHPKGRRAIMIRMQSTQERDKWMKALSDAANLTIQHFYQYDKKGKQLGKGRYATVWPARLKLKPPQTHDPNPKIRHDRPPYNRALKIVDKKMFWERVGKGRERHDTLVRETCVMAALTAHARHAPTFLRLNGFFETSDHLVLDAELLEGTDLFRHVSDSGYLEEDQAAPIMRDILHCLALSHRLGIAHRDVKPANVMMNDCNPDGDARTDGGVKVKLGDWGMADFVGKDGLLRGRCGTPGYVAPEILNAEVNAGYPNKVDVFSAGVTLYVLLCGYEPFYGESDAELVAANKLAHVEFPEDDWEDVSEEAVHLIKRMMEVDPTKRIELSDALSHPWLLQNAPPIPWTEDDRHADIDSKDDCTVS